MTVRAACFALLLSCCLLLSLGSLPALAQYPGGGGGGYPGGGGNGYPGGGGGSSTGWVVDHYTCQGTSSSRGGPANPWASPQAPAADGSVSENTQDPYSGEVCAGTLIPVLKWNATGAAPAQVSALVTVNCNAGSAYGTGTNPPSNAVASDSFSDPFVAQNSPQCSGTFTHLVQMSNAGLLTTVSLPTITVAVSGSVTGYNYSHSNAWAIVKTQVFPASLQAASTGQALSLTPAYFSGIACPVQAVAPAISGTVVHAQILVDGVVFADVVNTNQASVTLNTTFDSLNYADGYMLPIRMKVWDSAGGFYDGTLTAPVRAPKLTLADIWTTDYNPQLNNDPTPMTGSAGGLMGGNTSLHVRLLYPPNAPTLLTSLRLHFHTDPDGTKDSVWNNQSMYGPPGLWSALCQDPDPSLAASPAAQYVNQPWNIGGRNGLYDVTATVTFSGANGVSHTLTTVTTFTRYDTLIDDGGTYPVNPTPVLWDPATPDPLNGNMGGRALLVNFGAAYDAFTQIKLQIYSSDQTLVRTYVDYYQGWEKLYPSNQWSFWWDGCGDPTVDAQGNVTPGAPLPRGVYLFQWTVADSLGVNDSDKSQDLKLLSPPDPYAVSDWADDQTGKTYNAEYNLSSLAQPAMSASAGQMDVFDLTLSKVFTLSLTNQYLLPGIHTISVGLSSPDDYVFLVSVLDQDSSIDRGGRKRYALQHNQASKVDRAAVFGGSVIGQNSTNEIWNIIAQGIFSNNKVFSRPRPAYTVRNPNTLTPNQQPDYTQYPSQPRVSRPSQEAFDALKFSGQHNGSVLSFTFIGHGSAGNVLVFDHNSYLVADRAHDNNRTVGSRYYLEDFADVGSASYPLGELHNVQICVLASCTAGTHSQTTTSTSRIAAMLRQKGVVHTINFNQHIPIAVAEFWTQQFWRYAYQGADPNNKNLMFFYDAADAAQKDTIDKYGTILLSAGGNKSFVEFDGKTIVSAIDVDSSSP